MRLSCLILVSFAYICVAQTSRNKNTGQSTVNEEIRSNYYQVPSYGYIQRVYDRGTWGYYVNGVPIDYNFFGSLRTINISTSFDLGKIGQPGRTETAQKFSAIWQSFRDSYRLNEQGRFINDASARTPASKLALHEFAHFVHESRPTIELSYIEKCTRCDGRRVRTGFTPQGAVGEVPCEECYAFGSKAKKETIALFFSGTLPERPKLEDLIKEGLVPQPKVDPVSVSKVPAAPMPEPTPATKPAPPSNVTPSRTPETVTKELSPEEHFQATKSKAQAGDAQAQYELGLYYAQRHERVVPLDYFEAFSWTLKASLKNHALAQNQLARMHETGRGTEKNLEQAIKWYRSSALLGCKQSQRWMGQIYYSTFLGSNLYQDFISNETLNLAESYAWFSLGSEKSVEDLNASDLNAGRITVKLNSRDHSFELSTQSACESERDNVAKNPSFSKAISEASRARYAVIKSESQEFQKANPAR